MRRWCAIAAAPNSRLGEAVEDFEKILRAGKNIVSTSLPFMTHPPQANPAFRDGLEAAAKQGGATCFVSGIDPGFANDLLPITLLSVCKHVEQIRIAEILNYATYNQPHTLFDIMGFGKPLDETPMLLMPGILTFAWGGVIQMMADAAGAQLDDIGKSTNACRRRTISPSSLGTIARHRGGAALRIARHRAAAGNCRGACHPPARRPGAALETRPRQRQLPYRNYRRSDAAHGFSYHRRRRRP